MTTLMIHLNGATYRLTTDHAASSYGVPVLVDADGAAYGPSDYVMTLPAIPAQTTDEWQIALYGDGSKPARALTAQDVVMKGDHSAADGHTFRAARSDLDGYEALTDYGRATVEMLRRFGA